MARHAVVVAKDEATGDDVRVDGGYYSVNGTEPQRVPAELRHLEEKAVALELLRRHLGKS